MYYFKAARYPLTSTYPGSLGVFSTTDAARRAVFWLGRKLVASLGLPWVTATATTTSVVAATHPLLEEAVTRGYDHRQSATR